MMECGNAVDMGTIRGKEAPRGKPALRWGVFFAAACLLASALVSISCFVGLAHADDAVVHVSYQWYRYAMNVTEDYEVFDAEAHVEGDTLEACVIPEAYDLQEGCAWRVMKNFAGGIPAGEEEITTLPQ